MAKAAHTHTMRPPILRYRAWCLDDSDRILWGTHVTATGIEAAIAAAHDACQRHLGCECRIELWLNNACVFTPRGVP
jgi:hypothetical protein